ncbi:MAG: deoxyribodipyrimidine photo-lyase, partial [Cyclobacteriaceae bacterium]
MPGKKSLNIVWLKRDIRTQDHQPLEEAEKDGLPYLVIYLFEPSQIAHPDTSIRHLQFIFHSLLDFNEKMLDYSRRAEIFHAEAEEAFNFIAEQYDIKTVFSYEEHGTQHSWDRDKAIGRYFESKNITWKEYKKNGVVRGVSNRDGWDKQWYKTVNEPLVVNQYTKSDLPFLEHPYELNFQFEQSIYEYPSAYQPAGETYAWKYLHSFTDGRGSDYYKYISKPELSRVSCGRVSVYLAWGNLSIKQAYQHIRFHENYVHNKRAFQGILTRFKWHCHF